MPDRLDTLLRFYEQDPTDAFTRFALAREYLKAGDTAQALAFFEALVREAPTYVGTYYHLGKLYATLGRPEAAAATFEQGIRVAQEQRDLHARAELQSALLELQDPEFGADD